MAGARYQVRADSARYPISLSPALLGADDATLDLGYELEPIGQFAVESVRFGLFWGLVRLGGPLDVSEEVNREVNARGGDGVVSLSVETKNCSSNWLAALAFVPFVPTCQSSTIRAIVVRAAQPPTARGETQR